MPKRFQNYPFTMFSIGVTLLLFLLDLGVNFGFSLKDRSQFIVPTVGFMVTLVVATIETKVPDVVGSLLNERFKELAGRFELYHLLSSIDDRELQSEVIKLARTLSIGEIPAYLAEPRVRTHLKRIKTSLWGSDYRASKQDTLDWWHSGNGRNWYVSNVERIKKGVEIERHFLLSKSEVMKADGTWDVEIVKLLQDQARDGILVLVLWADEMPKHGRKATKDILQDFALLDGEEVSVSIGHETVAYRLPSDKVKYYIEIFEEQREFAYNLEDILPKL